MLAQKSKHPAISLYKKRFEYEQDNLLENFQAIKNQYFENEYLLNIKDRKIHLISLLNDFKYLRAKGLLNIVDSLPLFKEGLRTNVLLHNGVISTSMFVTILSASNTAGDFEYSRYFLKVYCNTLEPNTRMDGKTFGTAHTLNKEGKHEAALDILVDHEFEVIFFKITGAILKLQLYFELLLKDSSYESLLFNFAHTLEKRLYRREDFSRSNVTGYIRFVQKTTKLAKIYLDVDFKENKLEILLSDKTNTQAINWLLSKGEQVRGLRKK